MTLDDVNVNTILDSHPEVIPSNATSFTSGLLDEHNLDSIISDSAMRLIEITAMIFLFGSISTLGLVGNVINIIVFFRQGALSSSSNVSLLALAFADIGCLLTVFSTSTVYAVMLLESGTLFLTPWDFVEFSLFWPHVMFVQIISWITAYIAFERCMCVVFPLKVKTVFSAKRSLLVVVTIAISFTLSFIPILSTLRLAGIVDPVTNATKFIFLPTLDFLKVLGVSDYIHSIGLRIFSLLVISVCTQVTVYHVNLSKSWRKSIGTSHFEDTSASNQKRIEHVSDTITARDTAANEKTQQKIQSSNNDDEKKEQTTVTISTKQTTATIAHSNRERRLIRMITLISSIFLICNTPDIVVVLVLQTAPFFDMISSMDNLTIVLISSQLLMESINSSINIVVYYRMSSRYKQELRAWLGLDKNKPK